MKNNIDLKASLQIIEASLKKSLENGKEKRFIFDWKQTSEDAIEEMSHAIKAITSEYSENEESVKREVIAKLKMRGEILNANLFELIGFEYPRFVIANPKFMNENADLTSCLLAVALSYNQLDWRDSAVTLQLVSARALELNYDVVKIVEHAKTKVLKDEYHPAMKEKDAFRALDNVQRMTAEGKIPPINQESERYFGAYARG